jgi:hypothetical protein
MHPRTPTVSDLVASLQPLVACVRTDVTASKGSSGSYWTDDALTPALLAEHVAGGRARGVCPMKEGESTTQVGLLDFDSHRGETPWHTMVGIVEQVVGALEARGGRATVWRSSGGHGLHVYTRWAVPQDAHSVRQWLGQALADCGLRSGAKGVQAGEVEVFPKQDEILPGERGNMFILPLAGKSVPVDMLMGTALTREAAVDLDWPVSNPVPTVERPQRQPGVALGGEAPDPISKVKSALAAVPNDGLIGDLDYTAWHRLVCAAHEATGGSDEGLEAVLEWSRQNDRHDEKFVRERVWPYIKPAGDRGAAIRRGTLYGAARDAGWAWAGEITDDGFDDVPLPPGGAVQYAVSVVQAAVSGGGEGAVSRVPSASPLSALLGDPDELPGFQRTKQGEILPIARNLGPALMRDDVCGLRIAYDQFRDEVMCADPGTDDWRPFRDADYFSIRVELETGGVGFKPISHDLLRQAVMAVAEALAFDSAIYWVRSLKWDGVPRVAQFLTRYFGVEDNEYHRAVSLYQWTGQAGRVLVPGIKADMAMILTGPQGKMKSSAIAAMVPDIQFFCEIGFSESEDNLARKMRGKLIAEIAELRGLHTRDNEHIKSFMSRPVEQWTPKYKEFTTSYARRLMFVGTSNEDEILADSTGNRRWLPVKAHNDIDLAGIVADRNQLWAEASVLFEKGGVAWQDAQRLAPAQHGDFEVRDSWEDVVRDWLDTDDGMSPPNRSVPHLRVHDVLSKALRVDISKVTRKEELRCARILKTLGYERKKIRIGDRASWAFVPQEKGNSDEMGNVASD